ncbi:adenosylcobinamide-GDP ribazoletransferase [Aliikangiella sp. IMCC44632]
MKFINKQFNLLLIAISFLSRVPVSSRLDYSQQKLNEACRYFALVGYLLGTLCVLVFWIFNQLFDVSVALILVMGFSLLLTGCFHEDGLADTCDGFGGGWGQQQKLTIMKDSRIGTYGAAGLWFALSAKWIFLTHIENIVGALLLAYSLSRAMSVCVMFILPYVTDEDSSKVKPIAMATSRINLLINLLVGATGFFIFPTVALSLFWALGLALVLYVLLLKRQIGGFTGDTLGAAQQIFELLIYLVLIEGAL